MFSIETGAPLDLATTPRTTSDMCALPNYCEESQKPAVAEIGVAVKYKQRVRPRLENTKSKRVFYQFRANWPVCNYYLALCLENWWYLS